MNAGGQSVSRAGLLSRLHTPVPPIYIYINAPIYLKGISIDSR